VEFI
jgi:transposase InsO family protein